MRDRAALFPTAQQRALCHGAHGRSAMEHTLLAPRALQLNASTHSCLSGHVPSGCGLAPLRLASLLRERGDLPDLSMPSALAKATSACPVLQLRDSGELLRGALHAEQELAGNVVLELCFLPIFAGML